MGLKESGLRGSLRNVSVGIDAILDDGLLYRWPADDGSGEIISDEFENIDLIRDDGDDSWASGSQYNGDVAADLNPGSPVESASETELVGSEVTVTYWVDNAEINSDTALWIGAGDQGEGSGGPSSGTADNGWRIAAPNDSDLRELQIEHFDDDGNFDIVNLSESPETNHLMFAYTASGDEYVFYVYNSEGQQVDKFEGSLSRGIISEGYLKINESFGDGVGGPWDDILGYDKQKSEESIGAIAENTGPNA